PWWTPRPSVSSISLDIGLKALLASQSALETIGHNVSNASTPGYSRQNLQLSAAPPVILRGLAIGDGVQAQTVLRTAGGPLTRRIVLQTGSTQQLDTRLTGMSQLEALLGEPGEQGLASLMQGFYSSLSSLAASPDDGALRAGAVQAGQSLAARFQE